MAELEASGIRRSEDTGGFVIVGRTAATALPNPQWAGKTLPGRRFLAARAEVGYIGPATIMLIGRARINPSFGCKQTRPGEQMPWQ
jgi:hypothetical protein